MFQSTQEAPRTELGDQQLQIIHLGGQGAEAVADAEPERLVGALRAICTQKGGDPISISFCGP